MKKFNQLLALSLLVAPLAAPSAMEISARNANDTSAIDAAQIRFSKNEIVLKQLQDQVTNLSTIVNNLNEDLDFYKKCSEKKRFYAPDADPSLLDADKCLIGGNSIVAGFPDVIYCSNSGSAGAAHFLDYAPTNGTYWYRTPASGDKYINVGINLSGQVTTSTYTSCRGKTVKQLYDEGKAFNIAN